MAASTTTSSTPSEYMSGRGRYWKVITNPNWPGLTATRLKAKDGEQDTSAQAVLAPDFPNLAMAIEKFETEEAQKGGGAIVKTEPQPETKTDEKKPMADSTKLLLLGLGIGVVGIGAYMLMNKPKPAY